MKKSKRKAKGKVRHVELPDDQEGRCAAAHAFGVKIGNTTIEAMKDHPVITLSGMDLNVALAMMQGVADTINHRCGLFYAIGQADQELAKSEMVERLYHAMQRGYDKHAELEVARAKAKTDG